MYRILLMIAKITKEVHQVGRERELPITVSRNEAVDFHSRLGIDAVVKLPLVASKPDGRNDLFTDGQDRTNLRLPTKGKSLAK